MISSKVPLEELKSLVRAELNFDRAFSVLHRKYDFQYENLVEVLEAIDSGEIDISSEEEKGSHVTSYHYSDDEDEEGDKGNDSEDDVDDSAQEVTKEDGKDDDEDEEYVSVGSSANSENEDESEDEEEETKEDEDEEKEYKSDKLFPHIIPQKADTQLAMLAYSFGKVLHHSILSAERVATLQQKVTELQRELFTLRTAAKWYLQDSLKQKRNSSAKNNSRRKLNAADLKAFKEVARKEVEQMVAAAGEAQVKAEAKYKRIIASLELAVNYLKLEGNGRVQQMQMMDYSAREMGQMSEAREEALRQMWHEMCCQVALNRIKAINQLANVNAQQGAETEEEEEEDEDEDEDEDEEGNEERHQHQHQHPLSDEEKVALHLCTLLSEGCPATSPAALDYLSLGLTLRYVSLRLKKGQGLGVYIIGGPERHSPLIVSSVCKKGAAARAARPASGLEGDTNPHQGPLIAPGDILLSVNGFDLSASTVEQATKLFLSIGGWCRLGLLRLPFDDVEDLFREEEEEEEEDDEEESEEEVEGDLEAIEEEEDGDEESDSEDDEETSDSEEDEEEEEESTESDDVADDYSNTFEIV
ncbi:hypothetical protein TYRP_004186 [Tyrophagus putrescentiae]|nr:hypothetical protein TYRP_004186 [Tyrophagus putrescentiae]